MKSLHIIILLVCASFASFSADAATPFRFSLKGKEQKFLTIIILREASVHIKGYDASDLLVTEAKDISSASMSGYKDISTLATDLSKPTTKDIIPQVFENDNSIRMTFQQQDANDITIQLPKRTPFTLIFTSHLPQSVLSLTDLYGELKINANVPSILISSISGPLSLTSAGLNLKKVISISHIYWNKAQPASPMFFISSLNADVNLYLPSGLRATLNLKATHNRVYSDLAESQLKIIDLKNGNIAADMNGGGAQIFVTTEYGNIVLLKEH